LAVHVIHNLDAAVDLAEKSEVQISDEQKCTVQVEEAAVWDMLLDELAFRFLRAQRELFVEFLRGHLAFN
jgi:hypothetical protein